MVNSVSVLIPTYNRAGMLKMCLRSILAQKYRHLRVIIYDDGSIDNTEKVVSNIKDARVRYHRNESNNGIVHARNTLLDLANTKYACWQDSDDISNINRIGWMLQRLKKEQSPVLFCYAHKFTTKIPNWNKKPARIKGKRHAAFATAMFEVSNVPKFEEIVRKPSPTTVGGEDARWREKLRRDYGDDIILPFALYYVRRHANRITNWRRVPSANKAWYQRMIERIR